MTRNQKIITAIVLAVAITAITVGYLAGKEKKDASLSPETRQAFYQNFVDGCDPKNTGNQYCTCVGRNVSNNLTAEQAEYLTSIMGDDAALINFVTPYTEGC
jgi:hypothetical protein